MYINIIAEVLSIFSCLICLIFSPAGQVAYTLGLWKKLANKKVYTLGNVLCRDGNPDTLPPCCRDVHRKISSLPISSLLPGNIRKYTPKVHLKTDKFVGRAQLMSSDSCAICICGNQTAASRTKRLNQTSVHKNSVHQNMLHQNAVHQTMVHQNAVH